MKFKENMKVWELGNDHVIIDDKSENVNLSDVYHLNSTSVLLFQRFENKQFTEADMVAVLAEEYPDMDVAVLQNDVSRFVLQMKEDGFVEE